jgi:hypothetical protein
MNRYGNWSHIFEFAREKKSNIYKSLAELHFFPPFSLLQTTHFYLNFFSFLLKLNLIIIQCLRLNDDPVLALIRCLAGAKSGKPCRKRVFGLCLVRPGAAKTAGNRHYGAIQNLEAGGLADRE